MRIPSFKDEVLPFTIALVISSIVVVFLAQLLETDEIIDVILLGLAYGITLKVTEKLAKIIIDKLSKT